MWNMTIDEAKELAVQGDLMAIRSLGTYYAPNNDGNGNTNKNMDLEEAIKWYGLGAEHGDVVCMSLVAAVISMNVYVTRQVVSKPDYVKLIEELNVALTWAKKAEEIEKGKHQEIVEQISSQLGALYYLESTDKESNDPEAKRMREKAISLLKPIYQKIKDKEAIACLGFALFDHSMEINMQHGEDMRLAHSLLKKCADKYIGELNLATLAAYYVGMMYIDAFGCVKDDEMAMCYLIRARDAGYDCGGVLKRFKKTLFGKYKYM